MRPARLSAIILGFCLGGNIRRAEAVDRTAREDACYAAAVDAQTLRKAVRLVESREKLLACAAPACPGDVTKLCNQWLPEVMASTPTLLVSAKDASDRDIVHARVTLNGRLLLDELDGIARPVDPGTYTLRCEHKELGTFVEEVVVIREGEKNRIIPIRFAEEASSLAPRAPAAATSTTASASATGRAPSVKGWVITGVGVVSLSVFAYLALSGQSRYDDWVTRGRPEAGAPSLQAERVGSFIALGVGVVTSGVGLWFLIHDPARGDAAAAMHVGFFPTERGASLELGRSF